jgi:aspartate/methionine/tyrosine aminotransferase
MHPTFATRLDVDLTPNALTLALERRRAAGARILDLTASNPTQAGIEYPEAEILLALASTDTLRYEPDPRGLAKTRAAIAGYYASRGEHIASRDVFVTASTSEAYALLFKLLSDPGDAVLVPAPGYPLLEMLAALESVELVRYPLVHSPDGWRIDRVAFERVVTARARAVVVVHPNNPTGSYVSEAEQAWLADVCARRGLAIVADEVFLDYAREGVRAASFATTQGALAFALSGLSKLAGLPQMKLGWIALAGPPELRGEAGSRLELIADAYLSAGAPVQHAAPALLDLRASVQRQIRARVAANERMLRERSAAHADIRVLSRDGGWYAVLELPESTDEEALCVSLVEEDGVLVHPGFFFDFARPGVLVVSLLCREGELEEGIARVLARASA